MWHKRDSVCEDTYCGTRGTGYLLWHKRDSVCEDTYCGTRGTVSVRTPIVAQEGQCL